MSQAVSQLFDAFNKLRVLVIGDVMIDSYVWGEVQRISPEAPVPVVNVKKKERRLGGAANVALNVQAMGAEPILCSVVGDDNEGSEFVQLLENRSISGKGIIRSRERITTVKERVLAGYQHLLRVDSETVRPLSQMEQRSLIQHIEELMESCDVIIFEDYDKGTLNADVIEATIQTARKKGIPTVVDPKKMNFMAYRQATLFKPNLKELKEGMKRELEKGNKKQLKAAVADLRATLEVDMLMTTLSEDGVYIDGGKDQHLLPAHLRNISDVSGAGDTVISIAALCLAMKLPPKQIASLSNLGGGLVCEQLGVVPIDKAVLMREAIELALL